MKPNTLIQRVIIKYISRGFNARDPKTQFFMLRMSDWTPRLATKDLRMAIRDMTNALRRSFNETK